MIVLGLDTATASSAVALRLADGSLSEARDDPAGGEHPGHATRLLSLSRELLERAGIGWGELDRIAVGVGPGTFTGLRVGIATARGLAQSLDIELVGVSSLLALAHGALAARGANDADPVQGIVAVIDARRGEVFAAAYEPDEDRAPRELSAAVAVAPERLASVLAGIEDATAGRARGWLAVGDGAVRYRSQLELANIQLPGDSSPLHRVSAADICSLALAEGASVREQVLPDYRRRPDAELALEGAAAGGPSR